MTTRERNSNARAIRHLRPRLTAGEIREANKGSETHQVAPVNDLLANAEVSELRIPLSAWCRQEGKESEVCPIYPW